MSEQLFYVAACPFEAARKVAVLPEGHPAKQLHGHSFLAKVRTQLPEANDPLKLLHNSLEKAVKPLDYSYLNDRIETPTDENLTRYVRQHLPLSNIESIGVQSTRNQGVDIDSDGSAHIWRRFRFEAAHQLPNVPEGHQCGRMHGHGFEVILHANQRLQGADMGVDFDQLALFWQDLHDQLHHHCLNNIRGLENPTSEVLAAWIWKQLKPQIDSLSWVTVYETVTAGCHFDGQNYRIWKEQRFESALRLPELTNIDKVMEEYTGHSYLLRLHLSAPLDTVMGWTVDYGDVKQAFKPVYQQLDHHLLDELPGLEGTDTAGITRWIKRQVSTLLPEMDRIDLHETPGSGAVLCWGNKGPGLPV